MRKSFVFAALGLLLTASAHAQFITDIRVSSASGRRPLARPALMPIRVEEHRVAVSIDDGVARTKLIQVFRNPNGVNLEGTYMFPLPEGAAISNFAMLMGGKMVQGEVLEREKASGIYEGIVRRQQDPALLEYMGKRLFRARVFPIPPQGVARIELSYDEALAREGRRIEWRYPYRTRSVSRAAVNQASVHVAIKSSQPVMTVYSPSHEVDVAKKGDHLATVSYESKDDPGDRDFVIVYGLADKGSLGATLFAHSEGDDGAFMLLLAPSAELEKNRAVEKDVVFVVDTSGSMSGAKMAQAKKALEYCVNSLGEGDRFNVVPFSTEARAWREALAPASTTDKSKAVRFVKELQARGGTNINDALCSALAMSKSTDRPYMIIFMTDGEPTVGTTDTRAILANVKKANQALTRLFVFGVGEDVEVELLDSLAEQNHGTRDYVGSKENIEVKISSFFEKVSSPVLTDVSMSIEGVEVSDLYPRRMPDLFRGTQLMVTGRYRGTGAGVIKLTGTVDGEKIEHVFERTFTNGAAGSAFVPRLWAVRKVGYLMDQIRLNGKSTELREEIVRLGKKYGVVTPYTSFLVVEDGALASRGGPVDRGRGVGGRRGGGRWFGAGRGSRSAAPPAPGRKLGFRAAGGAGGADTGPRAGAADARSDALESELAEMARQSKSPSAKRAKPAANASGGQSASGDDANARLKAERDGAVARLNRLYFTDAIALSKQVRDLRQRRVEGGRGGLVRRVGNRTFLVREGLILETAVLDLTAKELRARLVRMELLSREYFELLKSAGVGPVLALGESLLFLHGEKVIQIVPAGAMKPAPGEKKEPSPVRE